MSVVRLNWATAEVVDGKLGAELAGEVPSGWKRSFEETVRLLGGGDASQSDAEQDLGASDEDERPDAVMTRRFRSFAEG